MKKCGLRMAAGGMLYNPAPVGMRKMDSKGTREGDAGYGQNGATTPIDANSLIRKLDGSDGPMTRTQRKFYGEQLGMMASKGMVDGADMEKRMMAGGLTATASRAFGDAANKSLMFMREAPPQQPTGVPPAAPDDSLYRDVPAAPAPAGAATPFAGMREGERKMMDSFNQRMGYAEGGIVRGKGGPTDDEVPMQVAGQNVNLSNTEAVLPAKTVQALGGPKAVEQLIEQTNGKPPVKGGLRAGGSYYTGAVGDTIDPRELRPEFRQPVQQTMQGVQNPNVARGTPSPEAVKLAQAQAAQEAAFQKAAAPKPPAGAMTIAKRGLGAASMVAAPIIAATSDEPTLAGKLREAAGGAALSDEERRWVPGKGGVNLRDGIPTGKVVEAEPKQYPGLTLQTAEQVEANKLAYQNILDATTRHEDGVSRQGAPTESMRQHIATQEANNPEIRGLRAAGVTGDVVGDVTVNGKTGPTGIRTITPANGQNVYAGRDAKGQLHVSSTGGMSAAQADKARDAEFAAKGYGKDAYGNWMTPQRLGNKQALEQMRRDNAYSDAFDPSITDPAVRRSGLTRLALMEQQDKAAAEGTKARAEMEYKAARLDEDRRQFDETTRSARASAQSAAQAKRVEAADKMLGQVNLPPEKIKDFKMKAKSGYLKDLVDKDGNRISAGLESQDSATQQAALQKLFATYLQTERANQASTNGKSATQFEFKKHGTLGPKDVYKKKGDLLWTLYDNDPNTMDFVEYAKRKIGPSSWYGGDQVDIGSNGVRVPSNLMNSPYTDPDGNLVMGDIDVRRRRQDLSDAAR
jgi:hypothetical protein